MKKLGLLLMAACVGLCVQEMSATLYTLRVQNNANTENLKCYITNGETNYVAYKKFANNAETQSFTFEAPGITGYECYIGKKLITAEEKGTYPGSNTITLFVSPTKVYWLPPEQGTNE